MSGDRVLVTPRALTRKPLKAIDLLQQVGLTAVLGPAGQQPTSGELVALLPGCQGWIAGVEAIDRHVLEHAPDLRVISRFGTGVDGIDLRAAEHRGIEVVTARGANALGVAELALALTLSALRDVPEARSALREGRWSRSLGREVAGLSVSAIGYGAIGQSFARLMSLLGANVSIVDPLLEPSAHEASGLQRLPDIGTAFECSDVVSLHCPTPVDGHPIVTDWALSSVRPGCILINTARAELVDDDAVLAALKDGRLGSYAVDAFSTEPPVQTELLQHPRVLATPHLGAYTEQAVDRTLRMSVAELVKGLRR
jgi:D-3-phosphoglycerate dehydrogenase